MQKLKIIINVTKSKMIIMKRKTIVMMRIILEKLSKIIIIKIMALKKMNLKMKVMMRNNKNSFILIKEISSKLEKISLKNQNIQKKIMKLMKKQKMKKIIYCQNKKINNKINFLLIKLYLFYII